MTYNEESFVAAEREAMSNKGLTFRKFVNGKFWLHIYYNPDRKYIPFQYRLGTDFVARDIALYVWGTINE